MFITAFWTRLFVGVQLMNRSILRIFRAFIFVPLCFIHTQGNCSSLLEQCDSPRSIGIITKKTFRGESEFAEKIRIACEHLQWKAQIFDKYFYQGSNSYYDWIFTLTPQKNNSSKQDNFLILFHPEHHYFDNKGNLKEEYRNFTGFLATYKNTELLLEDVEHNKKKIYPNTWYPTAPYREYRQVTPTRLFNFMGLWGDRRKKRKYQIMQHKLSQTNYANLFGDSSVGRRYGQAYKGEIHYDGKSVMNTISDMGVCLVLHSEAHIKNKIPSGRIFEAAAASAVIISDLNPFVVKYFGDSVLYVNQKLSGDEIFNQINSHMDWIQNHPQEALEMAKKSYQIFVEHFLLEQQLLDFDLYYRSL